QAQSRQQGSRHINPSAAFRFCIFQKRLTDFFRTSQSAHRLFFRQTALHHIRNHFLVVVQVTPALAFFQRPQLSVQFSEKLFLSHFLSPIFLHSLPVSSLFCQI